MLPDLAPRARLLAATALAALVAAPAARAAPDDTGTLFITSSTYAGNAGTVVVGQALPDTNGAVAVADGTYPTVFNNVVPDPNFGITAPITLSSSVVLTTGNKVPKVEAATRTIDLTAMTGVSTSFSSKSELAVNPSTSGNALTLVGYATGKNQIDISNSNTPDRIDPTDTDTAPATNRAVITVPFGGKPSVTQIDAYSGNNGRASLLLNGEYGGSDVLVTVGNAGNGSGTEPTSIVSGTGVQTLLADSTSPVTYPVGTQQGTPGSKNGFQFGFSVASLGDAADKSGKDDNFRGLTTANGQYFVSKGSGGNGVNTVYSVTLTDGAAVGGAGTVPATIAPLPGFPTGLAADISETTPSTEFYPFGIFVANATTVYVADEGSQDLNADPNAGLQKWHFDGTSWQLLYTLQAGLDLDQPYAVANYPTMYEPATTGLRNISGVVHGTKATIFAASATFSALGDPGADPNRVVMITDDLDATTLPATATFKTVRAPKTGHVYRGVAYVPCTTLASCERNSLIIAH